MVGHPAAFAPGPEPRARTPRPPASAARHMLHSLTWLLCLLGVSTFSAHGWWRIVAISVDCSAENGRTPAPNSSRSLTPSMLSEGPCAQDSPSAPRKRTVCVCAQLYS
jgi:hypothetical protein